MNRIHFISGITIATIALLLVTTTMSDLQSAFAHKNHRHHNNHGNDGHHHNHGNDGAAAAQAGAGDSAASAAAAGGSAAAAAAAGDSAASGSRSRWQCRSSGSSWWRRLIDVCEQDWGIVWKERLYSHFFKKPTIERYKYV